MPDPNFMVNFVKKCVADGSNTTESMIETAQDQILEIDRKLKTMDELKIKKVNLQSVLKQLGTPKKPSQEAADWDFSQDLKDLGGYRLELLSNICDYVEATHPCVPDDIIRAVASYDEQKQVYLAIKWLSVRDVIAYDDNRALIAGPEWEKRPTVETNKIEDNQQNSQ